MRRLLFIFMVTIGCAGVLTPLHAAGLEDYDWFKFNGMNLHARFFVDPDFDASTLEQTAINQADKQAIEEDRFARKRTLFNINLMFGISLPYISIKQIRSVTLYQGMMWPSTSTGKFLGISPSVNLDFMFNVAKYFALGFGADLNFIYLMSLKPMSSGSGGFGFLMSSMSSTVSWPIDFSTGVSSPIYYIEVPVYGLTRIYFSEKYKTAYLSLGAGVDFFLLGRPTAQGIIARGGLGFILNNGFMMEFAYQYNHDLAQDSQLTNIKDIHRATWTMGCNFNVGESKQNDNKNAGKDTKGGKQG